MTDPFIADLHIHSHRSLATSKDLVPEHLDRWARIKGIQVVGTGDFTHPAWVAELRDKTEPAEPGLFRLKSTYQVTDDVPAQGLDRPARFVLSAEISTIYKYDGKTRKVHHLILAPDFDTVERIQRTLGKIGNITSDGRPILGLDSRDLLEICLQANPDVVFIPAHIWTPWFSALGDKSGFDSIEQCYRDLAGHIHAIETGLSSDPPMNWRCTSLDRFQILSNSDAHSPEKLGREGNLFSTDLSYPAMAEAIRTGTGLDGTIEFFPQEGKYHHDGHRKCNVSWEPTETDAHQAICPVCGKPVTVGVMHRVIELADRADPAQRPHRRPFYSLIPLREVLSEILGVGPATGKVTKTYHALMAKLGSEFDVLLHQPLEAVREAGGDTLAEAMRRMREGRVHVQAGYDGEYGVIRVFDEQERKGLGSQSLLFSGAFRSDKRTEPKSFAGLPRPVQAPAPQEPPAPPATGLNSQQQAALDHLHGPAAIIAGPGTGKTRVLTHRIARLIQGHGVPPEQVLAVTFTNKAAAEMRQRLDGLLGSETAAEVLVCTFHALGLALLKEHLGPDLALIDADQREQVLARIGCDKRQIRKVADAISAAKQQLAQGDIPEWFHPYQDFLLAHGLLDLDDLIYRSTLLLQDDPAVLAHWRDRFRWVLVDEYQDVNLAQYRMIRLLCPDDASNLCVIGDPNQAIYGFRGADVRFIRRFLDDYPAARVYPLTTSYRCPRSILTASGQVVGMASMLEGLASGLKLQMVQHPTDKAEAEYVARTIEHLMGGLRFFSIDSQVTDGQAQGHGLSDFAVLCRTAGQMPAIEKAFHDHSIPYQRIGQEPFFKQEPVRTVIEALKLAMDPGHPFLGQGLGDRKATVESALTTLRIDPQVPARDVVLGLARQILDPDDPALRDLADLMAGFDGPVRDFIQFADLATSVDTFRGQVERVTLMTLHASKGLEFPCVFIAGCEDGLLPYGLFADRKADVEEEQRLLYVGMTRAMERLTLTWAQSRMLNGRRYELAKSPFLDRIEQELVEHSKAQIRKRRHKEDNQPTLF